MIRLTAIVSGGQTGADRGGLDAAIQLGLGWGGWAPAGWRAEDGTIPEIYRSHMRETSSSDYGMRTRLNVQDSDGTLIVSFSTLRTGGSALTGRTCKTQRKPAKHLVLPGPGGRVTDEVRQGLLDWVNEKGISVLNVAGPRESKEPGLQQAVRDALVWIFEESYVTPRHVAIAEFLEDVEISGAPTKASVADLVDAYYALPGNGAGGSLHIVLDDGNCERGCVEYCRAYAEQAGDAAGVALADLLLKLTDEQLAQWVGKSYEADE